MISIDLVDGRRFEIAGFELDVGQTSFFGVGQVVQDVVLGGALEDRLDLLSGRGTGHDGRGRGDLFGLEDAGWTRRYVLEMY